MLTVFINGSPKAKHSASGALLMDLKGCFTAEMEFVDIHCLSTSMSEDALTIIHKADNIVIAFPLYVDAVPSHLLRCLEQINGVKGNVYALCNSGFYEPEQTVLALDIIKNWCLKKGMKWKCGVGIGGGGAIAGITAVFPGKYPKKNIGKAFFAFAERITKGEGGENSYASIDIPRTLYKTVAETGWRKAVLKNGLKTVDLDRKL